MKLLWLFILFSLAATASNCSAEQDLRGSGDFDGNKSGEDKDTGSDRKDDTDNNDENEWDSAPGRDSSGCSSMDILFIIDDSASMSEEQENLKTNFPKFMQVLDSYKTPDGDAIDYRVGVTTIGVVRSFKLDGRTVTTEDMNTTVDDGVLLGKTPGPDPNCDLTDPWLTLPGQNTSSTFNCMATLGTAGTFTEMPFAVIENALGERSEPGQANEGFYRKGEDSLLVVVIITDEDDCSIENGGKLVVSAMGASDCNEEKSQGLYPVERTKAFLDHVAGGKGRYVLIAIAAHTQCLSDFGKADQAPRLKALVEQCKQFGIFGDICEGDLWKSLEEGLNTMEATCRDMPVVV